MIEKQERWKAGCNKCGKKFETMGKEYIASYKCSLESDLKTNGWKIKNNNCWCPECKKEVR